MAGHSRSKNGVASLAYVPAIHAFLLSQREDVDARDKPGHDDNEHFAFCPHGIGISCTFFGTW
jgi:hypothetical protein